MHQDTNGNVFFETNLEQWAKTFHNGRRSSIEIAGPSIPAQSEWIDIEDFSEEDSLDIFDLETSNAPSDGEKMCQLDRWLENYFSRTEWKKYIRFRFFESIFYIRKQPYRWWVPSNRRRTISSTGKWLNVKLMFTARNENFNLQYFNRPANSIFTLSAFYISAFV